jgi:hypothetical protein
MSEKCPYCGVNEPGHADLCPGRGYEDDERELTNLRLRCVKLEGALERLTSYCEADLKAAPARPFFDKLVRMAKQALSAAPSPAPEPTPHEDTAADGGGFNDE